MATSASRGRLRSHCRRSAEEFGGTRRDRAADLGNAIQGSFTWGLLVTSWCGQCLGGDQLPALDQILILLALFLSRPAGCGCPFAGIALPILKIAPER